MDALSRDGLQEKKMRLTHTAKRVWVGEAGSVLAIQGMARTIVAKLEAKQ